MPTKAVAAETMQVGKKGGGKHWTKSDVAARKSAADKIKRADAPVLTPPSWVSGDARTLWKKKLSEIAGLNASAEMLDNIDSETLGLYCTSCVQYGIYARKKKKTHFEVNEMISIGRLILNYADKLGFTPSGRARLVKRIADPKQVDDPFKKFD